MIDAFTLKIRQAMPLTDKIAFTQRRITEWVKHFGERELIETLQEILAIITKAESEG